MSAHSPLVAVAPRLLPPHVRPNDPPAEARRAAANTGSAVAWAAGGESSLREYGEVAGVLAAVTVVGWFLPVSYHALGQIYLLVVIALCLRVGRGPVLFAAVISALAWNYVFMPPRRMAFSPVNFDDGLVLGIYVVAALIAGQLIARIRGKEREERQREQRSRALFHLTRALAGARTLDEAVEAALGQADDHFHAQTALLLASDKAGLTVHPAGRFRLDDRERAAADWAAQHRCETGRFTTVLPDAAGLHVPMVRGDRVLGVLSVRWPAAVTAVPPAPRDLLEGFAAQIALLIEREHLRAAGEREKFFAESARLHRTLLDSVSHELKTPLAVLRSAGGKLDTDDAKKRAGLAAEIRTATQRLDHLVANLLNQTRLESGGLKPQLDWCDARDLVNAARRAVGEALAGRVCKTEIPGDLPLFRTDAPLMEQVIANLLLNAALHTPAGTPVLVAAGVERRTGADWIFLRVADRGPGLPAELRENLFQKFRRGQTARAGGLGLGLSIVRGFVLAQGGEVVADDNPGGGARFTVYLPLTAHGSVPNDER